MKKIYFLLVAMLCSVAAQAWTVYFTNPKGWSQVSAYTFGGAAGEALGTWPGTAMTQNGDVWTVSYDGDEPSHIIFNNKGAGAQTGNLVFQAGATYDFDGVVGAAKTDYTVYFDNSVGNWDAVYAYTFEPELLGGWPGTEITEKNSEGLYVLTLSLTSEPSMKGIIFNNGGNGAQTDNLEWETGATYNANGNSAQEPSPMEEWYVSIGGAFVEGDYEWNWGTGYNPVDGVASLGEYEIGTDEFEIKVWNGVADTYYDSTTPVEAGTWVELSTDTGSHTTVADAKAGDKYSVRFDCNTNEIYLTYTGSSAINAVAAEAAQAPAVYYNLQGIQVANPEAGLYIQVQGGKATKVIK